MKEVKLLPDCQCHAVCDWHYKWSKSTGKRHHWFRCFHRNPRPPLNCEEKQIKAEQQIMLQIEFHSNTILSCGFKLLDEDLKHLKVKCVFLKIKNTVNSIMV